jgi:hypothetical protein
MGRVVPKTVQTSKEIAKTTQMQSHNSPEAMYRRAMKASISGCPSEKLLN